MAKPASLLQGINAFARDFARDEMPRGYAWDLVDYVPAFLDTQLTSRGGWRWGSNIAPGDIEGGIYAIFKAGDKLLVNDATGVMSEVNLATGALTAVGGQMHRVAQNPVQYMEYVIVPDAAGANPARAVSWTGSAYTNVAFHASALKGRYAAVYKGRIVLANAVGFEGRVAFSPPGLLDPDEALPDNTGKPDLIPWDQYSYFPTALPLTGLGALRAVILLFHQGSVERLRGAKPPETADPLGDMFLEPLYDRAGCGDARSIAYWNDNCIFADERGVHFTDGAIVKNLCSQGGILYYWRTLYRNKTSIAAATYLDYYIVTVIRTDGVAVTLICDLNRRAWFRFTNFRALSYIHSVGAQEQLWGGRQGAKRLVALSNAFFPDRLAEQIDDDGSPVLPVIETPWYRLSEEGRKRVRHAYLSYDARVGVLGRVASDGELGAHWRGAPDSEGQVLEPFVAPKAEDANVEVMATLGKILELGYITNPHDLVYTLAGGLPATTHYSRYKLPIRKNPYGIAFRIRQLTPSFVTRLYELGIEAQADERSRL